MKINEDTIFTIILTVILVVGIFIMISGTIEVKIKEKDCLKSQTSAIEINGELKDFLICTSDELPRIIKAYEKN